MYKIKKGDTVQITKGRDRDKKANVLKIFPSTNKALVEGMNLMKKHKRQTRQDQPGGIVSIEAPISLSNLMLICKHCNRATHVGFKVLADGTKSRFCKICKEVL